LVGAECSRLLHVVSPEGSLHVRQNGRPVDLHAVGFIGVLHISVELGALDDQWCVLLLGNVSGVKAIPVTPDLLLLKSLGLGALGIVLRVMIKTKECKIVKVTMRGVMIQMRDLALLNRGVPVEAPTQTAPPATLLEHLRFGIWWNVFAFGHRVAPVKRPPPTQRRAKKQLPPR
jgi:hypothetical protein